MDEYKKKIINTELRTGLGKSDNKEADLSVPTVGNIRATIENYLSILSAKKLWAKAPIIQMPYKNEQKIFDKIWNDQNLQYKLMFVIEQLVSKNGKVYVVVQPDSNGVPIVRMAESGLHTEIGNKLVDVTIFTRITAGSRLYIVSERYKGGNITTKVTTDKEVDGKTETVDVSLDEFNKEADQNTKATGTYEGTMPVILLENINSYDGYGLSDTWNLDDQFALVQKLWDRIFWELDTNMNRIYVDTSVGKGTSGRGEAAYNHWVGKGVVVETPGISIGSEGRFNLVTSNLDINSLLTPFFKVFDWIFESAGFKRNSDDKGTVQQNDLEIQQVRDSEITTFKLKESTRQIFLCQIINKMFEIMGKPLKFNPTIEIQFMSVKNETAVIENMKAQLESNLISHVDAIAKINNISQADAKTKFKEIQDEIETFTPEVDETETTDTTDTSEEGETNETSETK